MTRKRKIKLYTSTWFFLAVIIFALRSAQAENLPPPPDYLIEARINFYLANEVVKYCARIEENPENVQAALLQLQARKRTDGINSKASNVGAGTRRFLNGLQEVIDANGGAFNFDEERYCQFGLDQIVGQTQIGQLLRAKTSGGR